MNNQLMWKMLRENDFEIDENINSEYLCTICKKILIEACYGPCGCRYCKECITNYLNNERKRCPGNSKFCKKGVISINGDIHNDQATNTRISRLIIKCPNTNCQTKVDLNSMKNHLEMCEHRSVSCPFINIGCGDNTLKSDRINEHLLSEVHSHTKLLMEWVNISRNETAMLKNDIEQLRLENCDLKEKMEGAEKNEIRNSSQIDKLRNKNRLLKGKLRDLQDEHRVEQASNLQFREKVEKQIQEIQKLNLECQMKKTRFDEKLEIQQKISHEIDIQLNEISLFSATMKEKLIEIQSISDIQESIEQLNYGDFAWKIDGWTEKQRQAKNGTNLSIYSKPFFAFKNGYKMCLEVYPDGFGGATGTHLSICYSIMKGPFDEILQWPFLHDVEISLMNQETGLVHSSITKKYSDKPHFIECFGKPITEKNLPFGRFQFINLDELSTIPGVCVNDHIVIKCSVNPPSQQLRKSIHIINRECSTHSID